MKKKSSWAFEHSNPFINKCSPSSWHSKSVSCSHFWRFRSLSTSHLHCLCSSVSQHCNHARLLIVATPVLKASKVTWQQ